MNDTDRSGLDISCEIYNGASNVISMGEAMSMRPAILQEQYLQWVKSQWPKDSFTTFADVFHIVLQWLLFPLALGTPIFTSILGLVNVLTFSLSGWILSIIWWIPLSILISTSWLWLKLPLARPLLLIPGVIFSEVLALYASYHPSMGEWEARAVKQAMCYSWPRSIMFFTKAWINKQNDNTFQ